MGKVRSGPCSKVGVLFRGMGSSSVVEVRVWKTVRWNSKMEVLPGEKYSPADLLSPTSPGQVQEVGQVISS